MEDPNGPEAEPLVQRKRCRIRKTDARDHRLDVFAFERCENRSVKSGAASTAARVRMAVDAGFDRRVVRRLRTPSAAARVSDASAVLVAGYEQAMRA